MIRYANDMDLEWLKDHDHHITNNRLVKKIKNKEIIILEDQVNIGFLRFNYFWDNTPFMNLLMIDSEYRNKGLGKKKVEFWENQMKLNGFESVMTSTLSDESPQHFYRKLGYMDCGSLLLEGEAMEILFIKHLDRGVIND